MLRFIRQLLLCNPFKWRNRKEAGGSQEGEEAAEQLRRRLRRKLPGFSTEGAAAIDIWATRPSGGDPLDELTIPPLILLMLHRVLGNGNSIAMPTDEVHRSAVSSGSQEMIEFRPILN